MLARVRFETGYDEVLVTHAGIMLCGGLKTGGGAVSSPQGYWLGVAQPGSVAFYGNAAKWDFLSYLVSVLRVDKHLQPFYMAFIADMSTVPLILADLDLPDSGGRGREQGLENASAWRRDMPSTLQEAAELLEEWCANALKDTARASSYKYQHATLDTRDVCAWALERY